MRQLHWFNTDLRIQDNPALLAHRQADYLLCVYCLQQVPPWCNLTGIGAQRERFLLESLAALDADLSRLGQRLLVVRGAPEQVIPELASRFGIDRVVTTVNPGSYEARQRLHLARRCTLIAHAGNTLFDEAQLPGDIAALPRQYTPFRRLVEHLPLPPLAAYPQALPPPPPRADFAPLPASSTTPHMSFLARGGTAAGRARLDNFLQRHRAVDTYAETRNALEGQFHASGLSPWLGNGCLSVREVGHALLAYEREVHHNESTRSLYRELLWREFFHWRALVDGERLFRATGIAGKKILRTFEPRAFARWCQGDTDYPLVNALMHQLVVSGWMSNRGRQIAASCLVNELALDWRYGAAFFEKHLVDYDVASNYGNWQYIAGVGCDPRGGRHFDIARQASLYDPDGTFTSKWKGLRPRQPQYVTDPADWPLR